MGIKPVKFRSKEWIGEPRKIKPAPTIVISHYGKETELKSIEELATYSVNNKRL